MKLHSIVLRWNFWGSKVITFADSSIFEMNCWSEFFIQYITTGYRAIERQSDNLAKGTSPFSRL